MFDENACEAGKSLIKINNVCKFISIAIKVIFAILMICWLLAAGLMLVSIFSHNSSVDVGNASAATLVLYLVYGAVIVLMFVTLNNLFSDASKGKSPFTLIQVRRLRLVSVALLVYALLDFAIALIPAIIHLDGFNTGFVTAGGNAVIAINFAPLVAAAVVFAFSFVFKYGVLLQDFSDEAL